MFFSFEFRSAGNPSKFDKMRFLFSLKCCANICLARQRRTVIQFALVILLSTHLCYHLYRVHTKECFNIQRSKAFDSAVLLEKECRNEASRPVVGCTTKERTILYKDDMRVLGNGLKNKVFMTLGIPTIQRKYNNKTLSYLEGTLNSLIENLSPSEMKLLHIVVFLADFDEKAREEKRNTLSNKYQKYIDGNLISVIQAPRQFYPKLRGLPRTYGDPPAQVFWRSKQNVDYSFLFNYCEDLSDYYMQMEDDVTTVKSYLTIIQDCIKKNNSTKRAFIEVVNWGFVGKIFKNTELDYFARMLRMFYNDMPCDWLIGHFSFWRGVDPKLVLPVCENIFFHKGKTSSLRGKEFQ